MKIPETRSEVALQYQDLLKMLGSTEKYLEGLHIDPTLLHSYKRLLRYLRSRPLEAIPAILGKEAFQSGTENKVQPQFPPTKILEMTFEEILDVLEKPGTTRNQLETIATIRFGVTKGGLSALRNRESLTEKIRTLISNERAHGSIERAAGKATKM